MIDNQYNCFTAFHSVKRSLNCYHHEAAAAQRVFNQVYLLHRGHLKQQLFFHSVCIFRLIYLERGRRRIHPFFLLPLSISCWKVSSPRTIRLDLSFGLGTSISMELAINLKSSTRSSMKSLHYTEIRRGNRFFFCFFFHWLLVVRLH